MLFLFILTFSLFPQSDAKTRLKVLFNNQYEYTPYSSVRGNITDIFTAMEERGIPVNQLFSKLQEGVSKKIAPSSLVAGLEREARTLIQAHDILQRMRIQYVKKEAVVWYETVSFYLQSGISPDTIDLILRKTAGSTDLLAEFINAGSSLLPLIENTNFSEDNINQYMLSNSRSRFFRAKKNKKNIC